MRRKWDSVASKHFRQDTFQNASGRAGGWTVCGFQCRVSGRLHLRKYCWLALALAHLPGTPNTGHLTDHWHPSLLIFILYYSPLCSPCTLIMAGNSSFFLCIIARTCCLSFSFLFKGQCQGHVQAWSENVTSEILLLYLPPLSFQAKQFIWWKTAETGCPGYLQRRKTLNLKLGMTLHCSKLLGGLNFPLLFSFLKILLGES